jgi:hypothetical protein
MQRSMPMHRRCRNGRNLTFFSRLAAIHYQVHDKTIRDAVNNRTWLGDGDDAEEPGLAASVYAMRALDPYAFPWPVCWPKENDVE